VVGDANVVCILALLVGIGMILAGRR